MQKPDIPANESDRLVALDRYKILDTLPEQVYDDLTQLAMDICGTPIALISLIDKDRQWFKSRVGIEATETPRDISFCGHAVAGSAILNVPDASLDPRFADNPLVTKDPNIRFYAGVPLITDDNFALGTLCVIDLQPHDLTEQQIRQLEALSRLVISQFELRLKEESLRLLASVVESSDDAIITKTLEGIITSWNPAAERLFGYSEAEAIGQPVFMLFPPDRLEEEPQILARLMRGVRVEHFETVRISKESKRIEVSATISPLMNDAGEMVGISKIVRDISDRKQAEQIILQQANRETLLRGITQRIRQSLDLSIIFDTACQEIQQLLQCDRVAIFKFYPESNFDDGEFVAESVVDGYSSAMEIPIHDHCFGENYAAAYVQGRMQVVNDIDNAGLTDCHRDILAQFQVRANLVIPLLCGNNLWGLLC
ncbi:GAF domain-containing protein, partial [Pseudanabaena sp. lw0831]|uniref:GAF domain-containing protein n=1 Tax=Pseudanabaena sp. lw0831 TaxID=1357935 RepID=UPI001F37E6AD